MADQGDNGGEGCPSVKGTTLTCIVTSTSTEITRDEMADDLKDYQREKGESERAATIAAGIVGFVVGTAVSPIIGVMCVAVFTCGVGIIIAGAIVVGYTTIAYDVSGGNAAGMYGDAWQNTNSALLASPDAETFTATKTTIAYVDSSNGGKVITSETNFNISGGGYSTSFNTDDNYSFFENPVQGSHPIECG